MIGRESLDKRRNYFQSCEYALVERLLVSGESNNRIDERYKLIARYPDILQPHTGRTLLEVSDFSQRLIEVAIRQ